MPESTTRTDKMGVDSFTDMWELHPEGVYTLRLVTKVLGKLDSLKTTKDLGLETSEGLIAMGSAWTISICTSITAPQ